MSTVTFRVNTESKSNDRNPQSHNNIYKSKKWDLFEQNEICDIAATNGWLDLFTWAYERMAPYSAKTFIIAAECGHLNIIKFAVEKDLQDQLNTNTYTTAAEYGQLEIMKWMRKNCPQIQWDRWVWAQAAKKGHLAVLQWMYENTIKPEWDELTCSFAAWQGHIKVIDWVRSKGCPWDEYTFSYAAKDNSEMRNSDKENTGKSSQLNTMKYLFENNCPYSETTHASALTTHPKPNQEVLDWLDKNKFPIWISPKYE